MGESSNQEPVSPPFPALTEERAEEIADALMHHSPGDDRVLMLAVEIALGVEPCLKGRGDNFERAAAAEAFVYRACRNMKAFDGYVQGIQARLADPKKREAFYTALAAEQGETTND